MGIDLIHRKDRIVLTTIDVMNDFGIQAVSTKEIARREGVTEGTIFKHFPKKNDLLLAVLDYFSQFDQDIISTIEKKQLDPIEAIIFFITSYATYYQSYPAITVLTQGFDELRYNPDLEKKVLEILANRLNFIKKTVMIAQNQGTIKEWLDNDIIADIILGSFQTICLKWRINGYNFSLKDRTIAATELILTSFKKQSKK